MSKETVEALVTRIQNISTHADMARFISELSHVLVLNPLKANEISTLSKAASRQQRNMEKGGSVSLMLLAISRLLQSAEAALEDLEGLDTVILKVKTRPVWARIISALRDFPCTPNELAPLTSFTYNISVADVIREMEKDGLVERLIGEDDGHARVRQLTARGYRVARLISLDTSDQ